MTRFLCYSSIVLKIPGNKAEKNLPHPRQAHMKFGVHSVEALALPRPMTPGQTRSAEGSGPYGLGSPSGRAVTAGD